MIFTLVNPGWWAPTIAIGLNKDKETRPPPVHSSICLLFKVLWILLKQVLSFALDFFLIYVKMTLTQFLAEIYFLLKMIVL